MYDYFAALDDEKKEADKVRAKFPDALQGRVLASVQFRSFLPLSLLQYVMGADLIGRLVSQRYLVDWMDWWMRSMIDTKIDTSKMRKFS